MRWKTKCENWFHRKVVDFIKLQIYAFENEIIFSEDYINILTIEDKTLYSNIVESFSKSIIGEKPQETLILTEGDEILNISKNVMLIVDPFNIEFNSKNILAKLTDDISKIFLMEDEIRIETQELYQSIIKNVYKIVSEYPFEITLKEEQKIQDIIKNLSLKINSNFYSKLIDKLFGIIDISSSLKIYKLLVFVNLKLFLNPKQIEEFYKYSKYHHQQIILLENVKNCVSLNYEKHLTIDNDYYETID